MALIVNGFVRDVPQQLQMEFSGKAEVDLEYLEGSVG
jgi:Fe-S cluster assembly scaffold protein SufB